MQIIAFQREIAYGVVVLFSRDPVVLRRWYGGSYSCPTTYDRFSELRFHVARPQWERRVVVVMWIAILAEQRSGP